MNLFCYVNVIGSIWFNKFKIKVSYTKNLLGQKVKRLGNRSS